MEKMVTLYYQAKQYHDHDIPRDRRREVEVIVEGELYTETEFVNLNLPRNWFRRIVAKSSDTYFFFGARFVGTEDCAIIEEDLK